ncbi:uncharacterized protein LOC141801249 [Halichoeres trimaculatus]|uniref:uncharacterized protein LOC141801249 n=1 Tax=Halichoeres trimaculatus TaxID=147232 RepID=UPI003D9F571D
MKITETLEDDGLKTCYVVTKYCEGGSLAEKIKEKRSGESEALSWIVEICIALKTIHQQNLLHKNLRPENILFTEFGKVCLGGFWKPENSDTNAAISGVHYLPPEVFEEAPYDAKSEIWSLGCILYQLCTQQVPFSAKTTSSLITKISSDPAPSLDEGYSEEFRELYNDMLNKDPALRPTAEEILTRPIILRSLQEKSQTTVRYLQTQLDKLKEVADTLESYHTRTTIGSLTGGVVGAAGGITTIVGLILAPFTFGASLIVTGVGIGVGVAGGVAAGASNITNMVSESSNRKAFQSIIKEFDEKVNAVDFWLQEVGFSLESLRDRSPPAPPGEMEGSFRGERGGKTATELSRGICTITAVTVQGVRVAKIGEIAAKVSRAVRVTEVATSTLSAIFLAFDLVCIALDAREVHRIRQAKGGGETTSEILKFVQTIRKSAVELQGVLDELKDTISELAVAEVAADLGNLRCHGEPLVSE